MHCNLFASGDTLIFDLTRYNVWEETVDLSLSLASGQVITSFDFGIKFNHASLRYDHITNLKSYLNNAAYYNHFDSTLRLASYSFTSIEKNAPLLLVSFDILSGIPDASDLEVVNALLNGEPCLVKVKGNLCEGNTINISAPYGLNYYYSWNTGEQSRTISITHPGIYFATVTPPEGNAFTSAITQISSSPLSASIVPEDTVEFCPGDSVLLTLQTEEDNRIIWSTGDSGNAVYLKHLGSYFATATNQYGCTLSSNPVVLKFMQLPDNRVTSINPLSFCSGDSVQLSTVNEPGNTYEWSDGSTSPVLTVKTEGTFFVTITGSNGCKAVSQNAITTVFPLPEAHIMYSGLPVICRGDSLVLSASSGPDYLYRWSSGDTLQRIDVTETGDYTVVITDKNGCINTSESVSVTVKILEGDLNQDGSINTTDFLMLVNGFGKSCSGCAEDINKDSVINTTDYLIVVNNFGQSCHQ
jgi:hypothetical protein